jgi:NAD(P)-dependent dehydrogenase (short-subunit alcohol dehydrogenase family)
MQAAVDHWGILDIVFNNAGAGGSPATAGLEERIGLPSAGNSRAMLLSS